MTGVVRRNSFLYEFEVNVLYHVSRAREIPRYYVSSHNRFRGYFNSATQNESSSSLREQEKEK